MAGGDTERQQMGWSPRGQAAFRKLSGLSDLLLQGPSVLSGVYLLGQDNGDCIVENTFSEDQHVEHGVHVQSIENGDSGNWVDSRY